MQCLIRIDQYKRWFGVFLVNPTQHTRIKNCYFLYLFLALWLTCTCVSYGVLAHRGGRSQRMFEWLGEEQQTKDNHGLQRILLTKRHGDIELYITLLLLSMAWTSAPTLWTSAFSSIAVITMQSKFVQRLPKPVESNNNDKYFVVCVFCLMSSIHVLEHVMRHVFIVILEWPLSTGYTNRVTGLSLWIVTSWFRLISIICLIISSLSSGLPENRFFGNDACICNIQHFQNCSGFC
jgi:hypothetical protein